MTFADSGSAVGSQEGRPWLVLFLKIQQKVDYKLKVFQSVTIPTILLSCVTYSWKYHKGTLRVGYTGNFSLSILAFHLFSSDVLTAFLGQHATGCV